MLATLDHPHVIQFYGVVTEQPIIMGECIVTGVFDCVTRMHIQLLDNQFLNIIFLEFAENGSIYDYLHKKHKEPTLKQSVLWAKEVTEGKFIMLSCGV